MKITIYNFLIINIMLSRQEAQLSYIYEWRWQNSYYSQSQDKTYYDAHHSWPLTIHKTRLVKWLPLSMSF